MENNTVKRIISTMLSLVLIISVFFVAPSYTHAEEPKPTKYHLDIGASHIWGNGKTVETAIWQNGNKKGGDINVTTSLNFPSPVKVKKVYPYSSDNFKWGQANYSFNKNAYLKDGKSFDDYYSYFLSKNISNLKATADGKKVTLSYTLKLESLKDFNLKEQLNLGELPFILEVLGGEKTVKEKYPTVYQKLLEAQAGKLPQDLYGFIYFAPIIIEYQVDDKCTVCGKCELVGDTKCTAKSCKNFGKAECGCYADPVAQVTPPADTSGDCKTAIKWSEIKSHSYNCGGCKTTSEGKKYCPGHTCNHVYTYQTTLTPKATLAAAHPNGNSTTFKSGYGFSVSMSNTISTSQVGNTGACGKSLTKANDKKPVPPTTAEVRTNWTVINKEKKKTQPKTIVLEKSGSTATVSNFQCASNVVSNSNYRLIYTDVALKGTGAKPVNHTVTIYSKGGGINGVEFCGSVQKTFTINGNMYEDFKTVDGRYEAN